MERLTDDTNYCTSWSDCKMPDGKCEFMKNCYDRKIYNKLREYEDAEEQGLHKRKRWKQWRSVRTAKSLRGQWTLPLKV